MWFHITLFIASIPSYPLQKNHMKIYMWTHVDLDMWNWNSVDVVCVSIHMWTRVKKRVTIFHMNLSCEKSCEIFPHSPHMWLIRVWHCQMCATCENWAHINRSHVGFSPDFPHVDFTCRLNFKFKLSQFNKRTQNKYTHKNSRPNTIGPVTCPFSWWFGKWPNICGSFEMDIEHLEALTPNWSGFDAISWKWWFGIFDPETLNVSTSSLSIIA